MSVKIEQKFKSQPGNPAYPRQMLLRLLVQAAIDGVWSLKKAVRKLVSIVDHDSGIIVANDVTQDCTDHNQLQPQLEKTQDIVGKLSEETKVSADNGYFTGDNLRFLEEMGLDGYIPDASLTQEMKGKKRNNDPNSKDKFEYYIAGKGKMRQITSDEYEA